MIEDLDTAQGGEALQADVCIVGAGMAGLALALSLAEARVKVLLLESGGLAEEPAQQALYAGTLADERLHSPPDRYRQRRWGGSSTIWGGRCVPFDDIDFEPRPYVHAAGWPLGHAELAAYYAQATALLEAGAAAYDAAQPEAAFMPPMFAGFESSVLSTDSLERFSCPTDLGRRYWRRVALSPHIRALLHAPVTHLHLDAAGQSVTSVTVRSLSGKQLQVRARQVVLATGGLEVPRLLLASRDVQPAGIGNQHDLVGRHYMCHLAGSIGRLQLRLPRAQVVHGYARSPEGVYCRRRLQIRPDVQRRLGLPNMVARLHFARIADPAHRSGVLSGLFLARRLISYEYGKRLQDAEALGLMGQWGHLRNVVMDAPGVIGFLSHWLRHRTLAERKFPSVILPNTTNVFSLEVHAEQQPLWDSRVSLGKDCDALGMPRLHVDWRCAPSDIEGVARSLSVMGEALEQGGVGQYTFDVEGLAQELLRFGAYGGHHVGTARMGHQPRDGVVDAQGRVHGVHNLLIASSAVFPTTGQANPSLLLVAWALRMADGLRRQAQQEGW